MGKERRSRSAKKKTEIAEHKLKEEKELTSKLHAKIKELEQIKQDQSTLFFLMLISKSFSMTNMILLARSL